ncbi:MAG TPA: BACON domain-containing carbohydrate-binding protein, partial [Phnomibacter sp.]|nr:BACON domain-containing carbohydrate-binding protein [Phnomibacter sp.]
QPWLNLSATNGTGLAVITASATDNAGMAGRTATITITAEALPAKTINVTQNGAPIAITLPIDFESDGTYVFSNFDGGTGSVVLNPYPGAANPSNKVGRIIRDGGAQWAGSLLTLSQKINFATHPVFSMKVYSTRAGVPVLLKLEGDAAPSEVMATTTLANTWETLNWNFAGKQSNVYNKLVLMFDFGSVGNGSANSTFHFDDIFQITQPVVITWTGNVNTAWENAANWSTNSVPTASSIVNIPSGRPRYPVVNSSTSVASILFGTGSSVTIAPGVELNVLK